MQSEQFRSGFPRAMQVTYLDTAAEGLPVAAEAEALLRYFQDKSQGTPGRKEFHRVEAEALVLAGGLLGTDPGNVTFLGSASEAMSVLANSIQWQAGDEVLISDLEFPSNVLSWLRLMYATTSSKSAVCGTPITFLRSRLATVSSRTSMPRGGLKPMASRPRYHILAAWLLGVTVL